MELQKLPKSPSAKGRKQKELKFLRKTLECKGRRCEERSSLGSMEAAKSFIRFAEIPPVEVSGETHTLYGRRLMKNLE